MPESPWRTGNHNPRTIYIGEQFVGVMDFPELAARVVEAVNAEPADPEEVSDGFHTMSELYAHRHALFIAATRLDPDRSWRSRLHHDGTFLGETWFVAGMDLPTGAISYHLPADRWDELDHVGTLERAPEWDGHTPDDVVQRLLRWQPGPQVELADVRQLRANFSTAARHWRSELPLDRGGATPNLGDLLEWLMGKAGLDPEGHRG
jgi:hypothetical protein